MPANLGQGNCQYTALTTAGTATLNPGFPAGVPNVSSNPNVLYGAYVAAVGTTFSLNVYELHPPSNQGTNTATATTLIMSGTATAVGQTFLPMGSSVGVRFQGAMVAVTAGTPGQINVGWD
jgi:hypothetical protein